MAKKTKKTEEITKKFGDERRKALDDALKNIEKDFGEWAEKKIKREVNMSTGIMIIGPSGSGKTTLGKVVAEKLGYAIT